jgi:hypothetical protein
MVVKILEELVNNNSSLIINWNCSYCSNKYRGNLLQNVKFIKEEYVIKNCRPDIALLDQHNNVLAVIEIVVTHKPEENVVKLYNNNKIILLQINLYSDRDLLNIKTKLENPDTIDICLNENCLQFSEYLMTRKLQIIYQKCNKCHLLIKACYVELEYAFGSIKSNKMLENEIDYAKEKGVVFEDSIKTYDNKKETLFVCSNCRRLKHLYVKKSNRF